MTNKKNTNDYEVGYKKPPKHSQFKKGQSGNKKGRPKGSKNANTLIHEIANKEITVRAKNGKLIKTTLFAVMFENLTTSGIKNDVASAKLAVEIMKKAGYFDVPEENKSRNGVLLLPAPMSQEEWEKRYSKSPPDHEDIEE
jgi:hypothetical protein